MPANVQHNTPERAFVASVHFADGNDITTTIRARNPTEAEDVTRYNADHLSAPATRIVVRSELR